MPCADRARVARVRVEAAAVAAAPHLLSCSAPRHDTHTPARSATHHTTAGNSSPHTYVCVCVPRRTPLAFSRLRVKALSRGRRLATEPRDYFCITFSASQRDTRGRLGLEDEKKRIRAKDERDATLSKREIKGARPRINSTEFGPSFPAKLILDRDIFDFALVRRLRQLDHVSGMKRPLSFSLSYCRFPVGLPTKSLPIPVLLSLAA